MTGVEVSLLHTQLPHRSVVNTDLFVAPCSFLFFVLTLSAPTIGTGINTNKTRRVLLGHSVYNLIKRNDPRR